jgi:hypothetical protein
MSSADGSLTLAVAQPLLFTFHIQRQHLVHQLLEQRYGQARAFLKHRRMLAEGGVSHYHLYSLHLFSPYCEG